MVLPRVAKGVPTCRPAQKQRRALVNAVSMTSLMLLGGCGQKLASADQTAVPSSEPKITSSESGASGELEAELANDSDLRRGYGVVDMRSSACVKRLGEGSFVGSSCPTGIVVYGPYVPVPADSEIDVSFDIKVDRPVDVYADIVSEMGTKTHAALNRQTVDPGRPHKLGYRVRIWSAASNVESRIGVIAEPGAGFEIANFTMTVR